MINKKERSGLWERCIAIYISEEMFERLKVVANNDDRKPSAYARKVIMDHLKEQSNETDPH